MKTIVQPQDNIARLWGKQSVKPIEYRLMKYLINETVDGKTALCNNVTGELVVLSAEEQQLVNSGAVPYCDTLHDLVEHYFLVPLDYDEYDAVVGMRKILRSLTPKPKYITKYTILPTTACNARCYYCFEKGSTVSTMTEQTADAVVEYIKKNCGGNKVELDWFGGEPTVAHRRISQICNGLTESGIDFSSTMITNGYLFDEQLVNEAVDVWKMDFVRFSFDGSRDNYNRIKNYVVACDDPYERVVSAVGYFLKREVNVAVRMNFDVDTADDFQNLVSDLLDRFGTNEHLSVFSFPIHIHDNCVDELAVFRHGTDEWQINEQIELDNLSIRSGLFKSSKSIPYMDIDGCMAANPACIVITPDGGLTRCSSKYEYNDFVGNIHDGITDLSLYKSWEYSSVSDRCVECVYIPLCVSNPNCPGFGDCYQLYHNRRTTQNMRNLINNDIGGNNYENGKAKMRSN